MQERIKSYLAEAKKWNLIGAPWWLVDLQAAPDTLYCSEQFALLFGLDPQAEKYALEELFAPDHSIHNGQTATQLEAFHGSSEPQNWQYETYQCAFQWFDAVSKSYNHFNNTVRILERDDLRRPALLYGVVEAVKDSSFGQYDTLFERYLDELITEHGYGYKWVVDLENLLIMPDPSMALLHGDGWMAGQWYPFAGIYDWTPLAYRSQVKLDTDNFRRAIDRGEKPELNVIHPHIHAQTGQTHWYNIRGRQVVIGGRDYSVGIAVDVTTQYLAQQSLQEQLVREELLNRSGEVGKWSYDVETQLLTYDELYCGWLATGLKPGETCTMQEVMSTMTESQQAQFLNDVEQGIKQLLIEKSVDKYVWEHNVWGRVVRAVAQRSEIAGVTKVVGYSFDITDLVKQKQVAQEQRHRAETAAELGGIGQLQFDTETNTVSVNQALRDIFQFSAEEYPEVTLADIESRYPGDRRRKYHAVNQEVLATEKSATLERSLSLPDGSTKQVRVKISPRYSNESLVGILATVVDLTDEIERQQQLEEMLCEREDAMRRQQQMYAIIGHELRTPVAAIHMLIEDDQLDTAEKLEQLNDISGGLLSVIDDLRLISNPNSSDGSEIQVGNPQTIVNSVTISLKLVLQNRGVKLHTELESTSMKLGFDVQSVRQIITNLVKNSALHSCGQNIYLSLRYSQTIGSGLLATLRVEDDGKGIEPAQRKRLFEPFERGDSQQEGTGLGLHIVSTLATKMKGAISCSASHYGGACFAVTFPIHRQTIAQSASSQQKELSLDGLRILLAEDEATLRLLTDRMLTKRGGKVTCCQDGAEALEVFKSGTFDLLLTDMMMPGMDGVALTEAVRDISPEFPIIAVTAAVMGTEANKLKDAGVNAIVSKPITAAALQKTLDKLAIE